MELEFHTHLPHSLESAAAHLRQEIGRKQKLLETLESLLQVYPKLQIEPEGILEFEDVFFSREYNSLMTDVWIDEDSLDPRAYFYFESDIKGGRIKIFSEPYYFHLRSWHDNVFDKMREAQIPEHLIQKVEEWKSKTF